MRLALSLLLGLAMSAASPAAPFCVDEASLTDLRGALDAGKVTSSELVDAYAARIAALDKDGPRLNAVRALNPDAASIAAARDAARSSGHGNLSPLDGIPILIKDNISTADRQTTTAGSVALSDAVAERDSFVAKRLRAVGAIILGKTNLTEFANFMAIDMPSGYSSLDGQVLNPYGPSVKGDGRPLVDVGGSSSGSASAAAASLAAATIGTETSGSLLNPASNNGLVTVKPTVGLISRAGIIPISASQDTAGPMTRSVRDAALLLGVLIGVDPDDSATSASAGHFSTDYTKFLKPDALKGARIGVPRDPADKANDVFYGPLDDGQKAVMDGVIATLKSLGATIVEATIPTAGVVDEGTGSSIDVANTNPLSETKGKAESVPTVLVYEFKHDLNQYLAHYMPHGKVKTLADIIAVNQTLGDKALRFGQDILQAAEATRGDLKEPAYRAARRLDLKNSRKDGIDFYLHRHKLDAILFPAYFGADLAARAGYPSVSVPAGFLTKIKDETVPAFPFGATFTGPAFSEGKLLGLAYAFETATKSRTAPALGASCRPE
ncbi:MAG: amidase family protein [Aliidongia sp.]